MAELRPATVDEVRLHLLVLRCQAGDERAFNQLLDSFGNRTLRYLRGLVGDAADDVQQEVWLAVYLRIRHLSNPRAFRTRLFRTTRHRAIDYLRTQKREELFVDMALDVSDVSVPADDSDSALGEVDLDAAMALLPPAQREVLLLHYRDDLSYGEIALVVGCSIGTVRSRLHHAKRKVREHYESLA
jgi:RNA polymerase sigma-70 factor (ECF subfamily)